MIPVKQILQSQPEFGQDLFDRLLTRPTKDGHDTLAALFHSDIERLLLSIQKDFPEAVSLSSIGKSYQGRPISLLTIDARGSLVKQDLVQTYGRSFS